MIIDCALNKPSHSRIVYLKQKLYEKLRTMREERLKLKNRLQLPRYRNKKKENSFEFDDWIIDEQWDDLEEINTTEMQFIQRLNLWRYIITVDGNYFSEEFIQSSEFDIIYI